MSWRSDWLYQCIFREVANLWQRSRSEGATPPHQAPDCFFVEDCAGYVESGPFCVPPVKRRWQYAGDAPILLPSDEVPGYTTATRGMFFVHGRISFHITPNRKHVIWNSTLGPRYIRAIGLRVVGQGHQGKLEQDPAFGSWIA